MQALIDTITNYWNAFIGFFTDVFASIKSLFDALLETIDNYYDAFVTYFDNVFISLKLFIDDFPILAVKKIFEFLIWALQWVAESCSYCMGGAQNTGGLVTAFHSAWNAIVNYSPGLIYVLNLSGFPEALKILTCGLTIWAAIRVIKLIPGI